MMTLKRILINGAKKAPLQQSSKWASPSWPQAWTNMEVSSFMSEPDIGEARASFLIDSCQLSVIPDVYVSCTSGGVEVNY